jgi:hypothetical protein
MTLSVIQAVLLAASTFAALATVIAATRERHSERAARLIQETERRLSTITERIIELASVAEGIIEAPESAEGVLAVREVSSAPLRFARRRLQGAIAAFRGAAGPDLPKSTELLALTPLEIVMAADEALEEVLRVSLRLLVMRPETPLELANLLKKAPLIDE